MPDGPLADPGVRYSRTGLVKRERTQKGWGDHRGYDRRSHGFRFSKYCQSVGICRGTRYRDSNPVEPR